MAEEFFDIDLQTSPYTALWHAPGSRTYFMGIDRGMLFTGENPGVPWVGLVSVEENPTGGSIIPFYIDGIRRRNDQLLDEFAAKISAYTYPREFSPCLGEVELAPGFFMGQQIREEFNFSYRSFIGDDVQGMNAAYELHLIYDALAEPSSRSYQTTSDSPSPETLTWNIQTVPQEFLQQKPSARIKLDSRRILPERLETIQRILYGYLGSDPRFPSIEEVYDILSEPIVTFFEEIPFEEEPVLDEPTEPADPEDPNLPEEPELPEPEDPLPDDPEDPEIPVVVELPISEAPADPEEVEFEPEFPDQEAPKDVAPEEIIEPDDSVELVDPTDPSLPEEEELPEPEDPIDDGDPVDPEPPLDPDDPDFPDPEPIPIEPDTE